MRASPLLMISRVNGFCGCSVFRGLFIAQIRKRMNREMTDYRDQQKRTTVILPAKSFLKKDIQRMPDLNILY